MHQDNKNTAHTHSQQVGSPANPNADQASEERLRPYVPVSIGELIDKVTILRIKVEHIKEEAKLTSVKKELAALEQVCISNRYRLDDKHVLELHSVNQELWDIEDAIRVCEGCKDFGPRFIELARSVYQTNDRRAALKLAINQHYGSDLQEEKSYADLHHKGGRE